MYFRRRYAAMAKAAIFFVKRRAGSFLRGFPHAALYKGEKSDSQRSAVQFEQDEYFFFQSCLGIAVDDHRLFLF